MLLAAPQCILHCSPNTLAHTQHTEDVAVLMQGKGNIRRVGVIIDCFIRLG